MVEVPGVEGVPVKLSNQVVAQTDARGLAFVPGLLPWHRNRIEIAAEDLPLDAQARDTTREVVSYARSGSVVRFDVRRSRQALVVLHEPDGQPVPIGASVRLLPAGATFMVARRGEVWLEGLAGDRQEIEVSWPGGGCILALAVPTSEGIAPARLGPLACAREAAR